MDKHTWQIAVLFAGAAVGGTYLSGYEWLRFFAYFGAWGMIGILLTGLGLAWFGSTVLSFCHRHQIGSLHDLYRIWFAEALAPGLSVLTHIVLLGYAGVVAGHDVMQLTGGAVSWLLLLITLLVAVLFLLFGWKLLVSGTAISLTAGFLLFALLFLEQRHVPIPSLGYQSNGFWVVQALSYLSLHFLLGLVVTIPLASRAAGERAIRLGVYLGSLCFFAFALLGHVMLLAYWHEVNTSPTPVGTILAQLWPLGSWLHALLSLVHAAVILATLIYALALPVSVRHDLQLLPLVLVSFGSILLFALLATTLPWSLGLFAAGATYSGVLLLVRALLQRFRAV